MEKYGLYVNCLWLCITVTGLGANITNNGFPPRALHIQDSPNGTYSCNNLFDTRYGALFMGPLCTNSDFKGNFFEGNHTGLRYTPSAITDPQSLKGNVWSGSFAVGAEHVASIGGGLPGGPNKYEIVSYSGANCPPSIVVAGTTYPSAGNLLSNNPWFKQLQGSIFECISPNGCFQNIIGDGNDDWVLERLIAGGSLEYSEYPEESRWSLRRELYSSIRQDSSLLQDSLFQEFYNQIEDSSEARFQLVSENLRNIFYLQPITQIGRASCRERVCMLV